jgi:chlorobactene glucosyltransferase
MLITSVIFLRNRIFFTTLPDVAPNDESIKLSILIPARNEEAVIETVTRSACNQTYTNIEVIVADDKSEDNTVSILKLLQQEFPEKLKIIEVNEKPDSWLGKPWACHTLSKSATGDIYMFIDADTELSEDIAGKIVSEFNSNDIGMITLWPEQILKTYSENTILPLIYFALLTLLPVQYVHRKPRWMPSFVYRSFSPLFAAACGQCIAFRKESYKKINGHESVKSEIVEDVALAKAVKGKGIHMRMYSGIRSIKCRMYTTEKEIFQGFRKNFLAGFNYNIPFFLLMALLHLSVFVLPFISLPLSVYIGRADWFFFSTAIITIILYQRLVISIWQNWNPAFTVTHPLGVLWFQKLGITTMIDYIFNRTVTWKKRQV